MFPSSVNPYMVYELGIMCESLVTLVTLVWFLPIVSSNVAYKIAISYESLVTLTALIWFLPCVHPHMVFPHIGYNYECSILREFHTKPH